MAQDIVPVKNYLPEELTLEPLPYEEARRRKRGMEDSQLERYYGDVVQAYDPAEANDDHNVKIPETVMEKSPNRVPHEMEFQILFDDLGAGAEVLYIRQDEEGEIWYGMPFYSFYGQLSDIKFNGFPDLLDHAEATGKAYGPLYDAEIMHEDLIGMWSGNGEWSGTPKLRNMLFSGNADHAIVIDAEDSHFMSEGSPKMNSRHILEMNPQNRDDEYNAVRNALVIETLKSINHIHEIAERPINKTDILRNDPKTGLDYVDLNKLGSSSASNSDVNSMVREVEDRFERGFHDGQINVSRLQSNISDSVIDSSLDRNISIGKAAKKRMEDDIEPFVEETLEQLGN